VTSDDNDIDSTIPKHTAIARSNRSEIPQGRRNTRNGTALDLVSKLSQAFDPSTQKARDNERANRSLQNTQFLTLSQQLRDAQATIEGMRSQITDLQRRVYDSDRARDRAETKLEIMQMSTGTKRHSRSRQRRGHSRRDVQKVRGKVRCEQRYPDGGAFTYWITDNSGSEGDDDNKENWDPLSQRNYWTRPSLSPTFRRSYPRPPLSNRTSNQPPPCSSSKNPPRIPSPQMPITSQPSVEL
jgi:hypothetical protein